MRRRGRWETETREKGREGGKEVGGGCRRRGREGGRAGETGGQVTTANSALVVVFPMLTPQFCLAAGLVPLILPFSLARAVIDPFLILPCL